MHKIINADIFSALNYLNDNSIDIAVTSPPYWAQRNYGFDKQIGNEETYMEFISRLVFLFDVLKNKLSDEGVFFLNIGDKYLKKYGKTPLGLIPYKLAYFLQKNGWIINDIIIWHKPNHMPSSVKNRFVNSYEPVFVLSKNKENYFTDFLKKNPEYTNIISVNLQPTPYKHVAVYPEKLVAKLLSFVKIEKNFTILDPFAGSGTTLKVVNENNSTIFNTYKACGIMIEYNPNYVQIIKERTKQKDLEIITLKDQDYEYPILKEEAFQKLSCLKKAEDGINVKTVNIYENRNEFYNALKTITTKDFMERFPKNEIIFIGLKNFDFSDIYHISLIKNWIIRNKLVVKEKKWYPIFMLVHDNKNHKYNFNYKSLLLNHKSKNSIDYKSKNFIGYKVENNIQKKKRRGIIIEIIDKYQNGLPKYVKVLWEDNILTKEFVINDKEEINKNIKLYKYNGYISVKELKVYISLENIIKKNVTNSIVVKNVTTKNYTGKFIDLERKNWGASPGARSSIEEEFFAVQRLYNVNQNIIADYLNYIRQQKGLSKKKFTELFPPSYKHTIGHWLRKDFGGSIPVKEDWDLLEKYFDLDQEIKNYACKTGLKLQTVSKTKYKIPDDVIETAMVNKLHKLNTNGRELYV